MRQKAKLDGFVKRQKKYADTNHFGLIWIKGRCLFFFGTDDTFSIYRCSYLESTQQHISLVSANLIEQCQIINKNVHLNILE